MSSVVETRKTPPPEPAALTPPMTPKSTTRNGSTIKDETPADLHLPDNYVAWTIKNQKELPPITLDNLFQNIQWISTAVLIVTPSIAIWGFLNVKFRWETFVWSVLYYFFTGLGEYCVFELRYLLATRRSAAEENLLIEHVTIETESTICASVAWDPCVQSTYCFLVVPYTIAKHVLTFFQIGITAGYHRLWAHRSYNAAKPLEYFLALAGAGAVEGSIRWWSRGHRAHHRYTDTDLDPYNAHKGFWWSHVGWMILKPRRKPGVADVSDLSKSEVVRWQHRWYIYLIITMGFIFPMAVAGLGWGDWLGGFVFAGAARLTFVHHVSRRAFIPLALTNSDPQSTFCVNSLAHWLGETPFDDKHTPKDHFITALVTVGEGYHNFHHQFPMDYRNAIKWYQYDPTKWFIWVCAQMGLASHLKTFPENEVRKGQLAMQLKRLRATQEVLHWAPDPNDLPVVSWESCKYSFSSEHASSLTSDIFSCGAEYQASLDYHCWLRSRRFRILG